MSDRKKFEKNIEAVSDVEKLEQETINVLKKILIAVIIFCLAGFIYLGIQLKRANTTNQVIIDEATFMGIETTKKPLANFKELSPNNPEEQVLITGLLSNYIQAYTNYYLPTVPDSQKIIKANSSKQSWQEYENLFKDVSERVLPSLDGKYMFFGKYSNIIFLDENTAQIRVNMNLRPYSLKNETKIIPAIFEVRFKFENTPRTSNEFRFNPFNLTVESVKEIEQNN